MEGIGKIRDHITMYDFRHLWISEALMAGNDVATVARMAGTSIAMIERGVWPLPQRPLARSPASAGRGEATEAGLIEIQVLVFLLHFTCRRWGSLGMGGAGVSTS